MKIFEVLQTNEEVECYSYGDSRTFDIELETTSGQIVGQIQCVASDNNGDALFNPDSILDDATDNDAYEAYTVYNIAIKPQFQKQGLGQKLYDAAIEQAKLYGAKYFFSDELMTVDAKNAWIRLSNRYDVSNKGHKKVITLSESILNEYDESKMVNVQTMLQTLLNDLPDGIPTPNIKIVNNRSANWIGSCIWGKDGKNSTISLQKSILFDEYTAKNTLAHELCHHAENMLIKLPWIKEHGIPAYNKYHKTLFPDHGTYFFQFAKIFNDKYGKDFVTEHSDEKDLIADFYKPIYVFMVKGHSPKILCAKSLTLTDKIKKYLLKKAEGSDWKLIETFDRKFSQLPNIGSGLGSYPTQIMTDKINDLWNNGKVVFSPETIKGVTIAPEKFYIFMTKGFNGLNYMTVSTGIPKKNIDFYSRLKNQPEWKLVRSDEHDLAGLVNRFIHLDRQPELNEVFNDLWNHGKVIKERG